MKQEKQSEAVEEQAAVEPAEAAVAEQPTEQPVELPEQDQVQQQAQQIAELENRLLRLHADFDNYRKRVMREREDMVSQAEAALVRSLLPVLDNFDRALSTLPESGEVAWAEGIRLVHRQLQNTLTQQGLEVIECAQQSFDPKLHEAVMRDDSGEAEDGTILQELQRGYQYQGRLLRPSMVKVASRA